MKKGRKTSLCEEEKGRKNSTAKLMRKRKGEKNVF